MRYISTLVQWLAALALPMDGAHLLPEDTGVLELASRLCEVLPGDAAVIRWWGEPPRGVTVLVRGAAPFHAPAGRSGPATSPAAGGAGPEDLHRALAGRPDPHGERSVQISSRILAAYQQRIAPVEEFLAAAAKDGPVRRLVVLLNEGGLRVPVEALTLKYAVTYLPAGQAPLLLGPRFPPVRPRCPSSLLILCDPCLEPAAACREPRTGASSLSELPGSRWEVEALRRTFEESSPGEGSGSLIWCGLEASAGRLDWLQRSSLLEGFQLVHFATHAAHRASAPAAALQLSGNGVLTAEGVLADWHLDADLVTLSACGSPAAAFGAGGRSGFAAAFLDSGARSVLLSLWSVDDAATALLMTRFYHHFLRQRRPRAESLLLAKRWLRALRLAEVEALRGGQALAAELRGCTDETQEDAVAIRSGLPYSDPFYWAGFILLGDPGWP